MAKGHSLHDYDTVTTLNGALVSKARFEREFYSKNVLLSQAGGTFLQKYGNPFVATGRDDDGRAGMAWGVYGVPETYLIAPSGRIKWRHAGPLTRDVISTQLLAKLSEMQ